MSGSSGGSASYADWATKGRFAPHLREHRLAGSTPVHIFDVATPAGRFADPPVAELVLVQDRAVYTGAADLGTGRFRIRGEPGNLYLVPPGAPTNVVVDVPHAVRIFALPMPALALGEAAGAPVDFAALPTGAFRNPFVTALCDRLWDRSAAGDEAGRLYGDGALVVLAAELMRQVGRPVPAVTGGLSGSRLRRVTDFIAANLAQEVGLADLARIAGLSLHHFCRAFKASTGLPPHAYQTRLRIERAKELLAATSLSVGAVAAAVGYDDPNQLARMFRKAEGTSPSRYRRDRS